MKKMFKCMVLSIMLLCFSSVVNAQGFFPTYNGIELANSSGDAIHWISAGSISYTGRSGIQFYTYKRSNDVNTYAYRWNVSQNFKLDLGKGVFSGYAFYQSHTESGIDIYGVDGVSLVSTIGERIPCTIENSDQITKYSCSVSSGFILDYIEINSAYYADPYGVVGISSMFIDNDPSQAIIDSNKELKDGIDKGNQIQQDTNDTIKDGSVDSGGITALTETKLPTSGVFSAILNLPVQFFQSLLDNLSTSTCKNIEFPLPFVEQNVSIPCVRKLLEQLNALQFYETIGLLVGGIAIFNYLMYMGKQFTKMELLQHTNAEFGGL